MPKICSGIALLAFLLARHAFAAPVEPLPVTQLAPGVYVHAGAQEDWGPANDGDVANLGFVVGTRCVAVIDSGGSVETGRRLRERIEATTPLPICYLVNTHAHNDHVLGNSAFMNGPGVPPKLVASARYAAALGAREDYIIHSVQRDFGQRLTHADFAAPNLTVTPGQPLELDLGGRSLRLEAWPTAHTDNDLSAWDSASRTLFLGDLLFVGHLPVLDGSLRGWLAVLAGLKDRHDVALAVPGHGPASPDWPGVLAAQQRYLQALLDQTRAAIKAQRTIQQAVDTVGRDAASSWLLIDQFHKRNVTAAYAELEWED